MHAQQMSWCKAALVAHTVRHLPVHRLLCCTARQPRATARQVGHRSGAPPPPQTQPARFYSLVHHIPDAVAGQHQERVVARQPLRQHIRLSGDDLVLGLQLQLVASSGQSKTISGSAAHPAAPRGADVQDPARDQRAAWRRQAAVNAGRSAPQHTSLFILYRRSPMARDRLRLPAAK